MRINFTLHATAIVGPWTLLVLAVLCQTSSTPFTHSSAGLTIVNPPFLYLPFSWCSLEYFVNNSFFQEPLLGVCPLQSSLFLFQIIFLVLYTVQLFTREDLDLPFITSLRFFFPIFAPNLRPLYLNAHRLCFSLLSESVTGGWVVSKGVYSLPVRFSFV